MSWIEGHQHRRTSTLRSNEELLKLDGFIDEREAKLALYEFLRNNTTFAVDLILGVKLFPFQHLAIKSMFETDYFLGVSISGGRARRKSHFLSVKSVDNSHEILEMITF